MIRNNGVQPLPKLNLVYIIGTYPLLTTTFIDREIRLLRARGVGVQIVSVRRPNRTLSPEQKIMQQDVVYLLPVSWLKLLAAHLYFVLKRPLTFLQTLFYLLTRPHPNLKARLKTGLHFGEGVYAAYLLRAAHFQQIHAHFVDRAATIAMVVSRLSGVPYSATAHANDIYVNPILLPEKLAAARFVATCTGYNKAYLGRLVGGDLNGKLHCIYHGLDVSQYNPSARVDQSKPMLLAVGQLKEKKGFGYLLEACALLKDQGHEFECQIVGEGPLRFELTVQIKALALENIVTLCGALPHTAVIEKYREAAIFVLPCITAADGDRDGIPNVILEALAMELPVVSTDHSGIPEVVQNGINGLLVAPADALALARALTTLLDDPDVRRQFGKHGRRTVVEAFSVESNVARLLAEFMAAPTAKIDAVRRPAQKTAQQTRQ